MLITPPPRDTPAPANARDTTPKIDDPRPPREGPKDPPPDEPEVKDPPPPTEPDDPEPPRIEDPPRAD
jgi:hypothetical protein